jgi:endonuclease/exonuclease/phosphatase family metal-dependent hydrolase
MRTLFFFIILAILFQGTSIAQKLKVATYNIFFLDEGISKERKDNLQTTLRRLDADVVGFQEIKNPAALENILPGNYSVAMIDDTTEVQEVALAVRAPLEIQSYKYVFPDTSFDDAFPRSRDLLQVELNGYGREFVFLVNHFKSRYGGRLKTDPRRVEATSMIVEYIRQNLTGKNVVILADFNDDPDDRSLNVLEYGDPKAVGGVDEMEDTFLFNTAEQLVAKDYCSFGLNYIYGNVESDTFNARIAGSREENNKWRDKEYDFYKDVKVKEVLIDQILISLNLKPYFVNSGVFNESEAVRGIASKTRFTDKGVVYTQRGSLASDHLPVWAVFQF